MNTFKENLYLIADLNKLKVTFAVTLTMLAGYTLAAKQVATDVILPLVGIFILACGSAAFNQYQEREKDALMQRTRNRPIPSGRIRPGWVLVIAFAEIGLGTLILLISSNSTVAMLGFMAFVWYNLVYTPLKRVTAFAVIPGSITGAIPPVIGWVVGGGVLSHPEVYLIASFFFLSQIPHFWLLMLEYGDEYVEAGFPSITQFLRIIQIKRVTFVWIVAAGLTAAMLVLWGLFVTLFFKIIVILATTWLILAFSGLLKNSEGPFKPFSYFMRINYFVFAVTLSMILDPVIR